MLRDGRHDERRRHGMCRKNPMRCLQPMRAQLGGQGSGGSRAPRSHRRRAAAAAVCAQTSGSTRPVARDAKLALKSARSSRYGTPATARCCCSRGSSCRGLRGTGPRCQGDGATWRACSSPSPGAAFDHRAAPAKPEPSGLVEGFTQGHSQAPGGGLARIGKAVGDDDEAALDRSSLWIGPSRSPGQRLKSRCPRAPTGARRR